MNIAIWGATGNVGLALMYEASSRGLSCHGYVRDRHKAKELFESGDFFSFNEFGYNHYDILINAISENNANPFTVFETMERYDYKMIDYARSNPHCVCISISSGAAYIDSFIEPSNKDSELHIRPNCITTDQWYGLVKLMCEQRHRALSPLPIIDLRLFSFISRYLNLSQPLFIADLINAIIRRKPFITSAIDFERDYIHPSDLFDLILLCSKNRVNNCYDTFSCKPVRKSEIISHFEKAYSLEVIIGETWESATGYKGKYYSKYHNAIDIGYKPKYSALDAIVMESGAALNRIIHNA